MKCTLLTAIVVLLCLQVQSQLYQKLHKRAIVADSHNDILSAALEKNVSIDQQLQGITHTDLHRLQQGGVDVQVFSVWCDGKQPQPFAYANRQIDTLVRWVQRNPQRMALAGNATELRRAVKKGKLAAMIGVEGGHMIEGDTAKLNALFARGARYMTLTWNNSNAWATSAMDETGDTALHQPKGLSPQGKAIVQQMNRLGMMVDLSHVGEQTFYDAVATTTKPVLVSHSCAWRLCPVFRNLKDEQIKAVAANGGVIQVNFYSGFLDSTFERRSRDVYRRRRATRDSLQALKIAGDVAERFIRQKYAAETDTLRAPFELLLNHIDYIVQVAGIDHVGLGSDFDGITSPPQQLNDVTTFPLITKALLQRGYSRRHVKKILGGNFLRVFKANIGG